MNFELDGEPSGLDSNAHKHQNGNVRTTIELRDDLYRVLKTRASLTGITLRQLVERLIEQSLRLPSLDMPSPQRREPPPVIVPPRGTSIPVLTPASLRRLEEEEDEAQHGRLA